MSKAVLISKSYTGLLDRVVKEQGSLSPISGRRSGDTTGYVHILIGRLMTKNNPYSVHIIDIAKEVGCTLIEARGILDKAKQTIVSLDFNFFVHNKESISYEPWL